MYLLDPTSFLLYLAAHDLTLLEAALRLQVRYSDLWKITHQEAIPLWNLATILYRLKRFTGIWYSTSSLHLVQDLHLVGQMSLTTEPVHLSQQNFLGVEGGPSWKMSIY